MSEITKYDYDKQYYPQIRAVLNADKAPEAVLETAIEYCKAAGLDIMRKPVAIISYGDKNEIVFTIQAMTTIASRANWAGTDEIVFSDITVNVGGKQVPEWGYQVVYKMIGKQRVPFTGPKVYVQERYKNSWSNAGIMAMFQKCILAAALRIAFPEAISHAYLEEEIHYYEPAEKIDNSGIEALKAGSLKKLPEKPVPEPVVEETIIEATATESVAVSDNDIDSMLSLIEESKTIDELKEAGQAVAAYGFEEKDPKRKLLLDAYKKKEKGLK